MSFLINPYRFGTSIPINNLVYYLRCDNNVNDQTGNYTPTNTGITFTTTTPPSGTHSAVWSGSTDNIAITHDANLSFGDGTTDSPFSISFWINGSSWGNSPRIIDKRASGGTQLEYRIIVLNSDSNIRIALFDDSSGGSIGRKITTALSTSTWYHIVFTYDGSGVDSGINAYLNGVDDGATPGTGGTYTAMETFSNNVIIGKDAANVSNTLSGNMDSIALWNVELTPDEITAIYTKQNSGNELI